jgi:DNA (cytosine-5)-methyltransferase 3A
VLSLFDGISCGQLALQRASIDYSTYYANEIEASSIKVTSKNFPNTIQLGDVTVLDTSSLPKINLLLGGSPCQGFSKAGKQLNFNDPRSKLFFEYARIKEELRPKYFLLENVVMKQEYIDVITEYLKVEPIRINSKLVSAQNRDRMYWTNIPNVTIPKDKGIYLDSILDFTLSSCIIGKNIGLRSGLFDYLIKQQPESSIAVSDTPYIKVNRKLKIKSKQSKSSCLTAGASSGGNHSDMDFIVTKPSTCRRYSCIEAERLQTLPDNYTQGISPTARYKAIANGWTVDVLAHLFNGLRNEQP